MLDKKSTEIREIIENCKIFLVEYEVFLHGDEPVTQVMPVLATKMTEALETNTIYGLHTYRRFCQDTVACDYRRAVRTDG